MKCGIFLFTLNSIQYFNTVVNKKLTGQYNFFIDYLLPSLYLKVEDKKINNHFNNTDERDERKDT